MLIRRSNPQAIHESEVTEESLFLTRRQLVLAGAVAIAAPVAQAGLFDLFSSKDTSASLPTGKTLAAQASNYQVSEPLTSWQDVTHYNNFYEFSTDKTEVADLAKNFQPEPWLLDIKGAVKNAGRYDLADLAKRFTLQERIYRLRCVEGWSMVIPWIGFPLADLIRWLEPQNNAKYVVFRSLVDPKQMPGQKQGFGSLDWPYQEALRLDEAMNPLSLMVMGLYGRVLPGQNGAPLRLAVPWKYGFKSAKSIVSIEFVEHQPITTWAKMAPNEYGFYANVNPQVDHPRWSQSHERRIGGSLGGQRMPTQLFNGYAEQVATLYTGLDLTRNF